MFKKFELTKNRLTAFAAECTAEAYNNPMISNAINFAERHRNTFRTANFVLAFLLTAAAMILGSVDSVYANPDITAGLSQRINDQVRALITAIQGITSGVAALVIIICFVMRMVSKNQRSVDEASTWLKRAAISLVCVNMIGFIITFIIGIAGNDTAIPT